MQFKIDVSRVYKNKDGYTAGGYKLNTSFKTEEHTPESFIETVVKEGWPYTMHHAKRSPAATGADKRGVTTPKHTENFLSMQVLTFDDDSNAQGVVDGWLRDSFFSQYGFAFIESVNSVLGEAEKGHPTIILDAPITNPELFKECLEAFLFRHKRLDPLKNIDRTIYNAEGARVHLLGNVCPFVVYEERILRPYRQYLATKEREALELEIRRQVEFEHKPQEEIDESEGAIRVYIQKSLDGIFDYVARTQSGRNGLINWAGYRVAGLQKAHWTADHQDLFHDVERRIATAASANGYSKEYGHGRDDEAVRIFNLGYAANKSDFADKPMMSKRQSARSKENHHDLYQQGYKDGWLDGFQAGLTIGRKYWHAVGMKDSSIGFYELGYSQERDALTVPYHNWSHDLLNMEYQGLDGVISYETEAADFFITDTTHKSGRYTFITQDSLTAMRGYVLAANIATTQGIDTPVVVGLPHTPVTSNELLHDIDSEHFIFVAPFGVKIDPSIIKALRGKCKFLRLPASFEQMVNSDGLNWVEWMLPKAVG